MEELKRKMGVMKLDKKIVIFGSFSGYNLGDKAILMSMAKNLKGKCSISVPSKRPKNISDVEGITTFKTFTAFIGIRTIHEVKNADVIVIGGGGLFFDHKMYNPFFNFLPNILFVALLAKLFGKKLYIFSVGANHLESKISRLISNIILNQADFIAVRDTHSKTVLEEISKKLIKVYHDPAFLLEGASNSYVTGTKNKYLKNKNVIILNLHKSLTYRFKMGISEGEFCQRLISILDDFVRQGYIILLFSTVIKNDYLNGLVKYSNFQNSYIKIDSSKLNPQNMIELLRESEFIIGSQLHSLILSTVANVPAIGFIYDKKVLEFLKITGQGNQAIVLHELDDLSILQNKIEYVIENNENIRAKLPERLSEIRKNSYKNFVKLESMINDENN